MDKIQHILHVKLTKLDTQPIKVRLNRMIKYKSLFSSQLANFTALFYTVMTINPFTQQQTFYFEPETVKN